MRGFSPPIRFLTAILAIWIGLRIVTFTPLYPEPPAAETIDRLPDAPKAPDQAVALTHVLLPQPPDGNRIAPVAALRRIAPIDPTIHALPGSPMLLSAQLGNRNPPPTVDAAERARFMPLTPRRARPLLARPGSPRPILDSQDEPLAALALGSCWSFSGWSLLRRGGAPASLASGGQLGGSQVGLRARYRLTGSPGRGIAATARLSRPVRGADGGEGAIGLGIRPLRQLPVEVLIERRIAIERGGRDAWGLGIVGGVDRMQLPLALELDAWAQAGIVGARSRDLYGDASASFRRLVYRADDAELSLGGGGWASAQPGAARVDIGPEATLRLLAAGKAMRLSLSWRQRIAGHAAPGSGPALTLGTDF